MSLVLVLSPTLTNQGPTLTSESGPSVIPTLAQSRLLLLGVCHRGEAKAASSDGRLHQSQLRWACHPMILSLSDTENYWEFQGYSPFHSRGELEKLLTTAKGLSKHTAISWHKVMISLDFPIKLTIYAWCVLKWMKENNFLDFPFKITIVPNFAFRWI